MAAPRGVYERQSDTCPDSADGEGPRTQARRWCCVDRLRKVRSRLRKLLKAGAGAERLLLEEPWPWHGNLAPIMKVVFIAMNGTPGALWC